MIKVKAFLIADEVKQNSRNNKLTVNGVFYVISAKSFPAIHKSLSVLFVFEGENKKYKYELCLKYKGRELKITEVVFTKREKVHQVINRLNDLPLFGVGEYVFEVKLNGRSIATTTMDVKEIS